ncbi:MAG: hypothetical protein AB1512_27200 [Thermodesulfobacteriota bacterium]
MSNAAFYRQVYKDWLKRRYLDWIGKGHRLQTPMAMQMSVFHAYGYLPQPIIALELFGMHGLWHTVDYAPACSYLELYEINSVYAKFAKRFIPDAVVIEADSIDAVLNRKLRREKYNFILSDNPMAAPYGHDYFEHFSLFPQIGGYVENGGILLLNFIYNPAGLSREHMEKRESFYGTPSPSINEAVDVYGGFLAEKGRTIVDSLCLPRNDRMAYLALILKGTGA